MYYIWKSPRAHLNISRSLVSSPLTSCSVAKGNVFSLTQVRSQRCMSSDRVTSPYVIFGAFCAPNPYLITLALSDGSLDSERWDLIFYGEYYKQVSKRQHSFHQCASKMHVSPNFGDLLPVNEWCHYNLIQCANIYGCTRKVKGISSVRCMWVI